MSSAGRWADTWERQLQEAQKVERLASGVDPSGRAGCLPATDPTPASLQWAGSAHARAGRSMRMRTSSGRERCWEQHPPTEGSEQRAGVRGGGWSPVRSCEALPELHVQLPQNESRSLSSGLLSFPLIWHGLPGMDGPQPFLVSCQAPLGNPSTGH